MYNKLESLRNSRNEIVQEILKLDKGLANLKTLENRFNGGEFYSFLEDIISLREKADMSLYEKEKARKRIEEALNINPIKEFGTNYAEHYHSSETAIQKLINEAQAHKESGAKGEYKGQVAGAFHRKELGDIDLVWGEVTGKGKEAKGYGLAKIIEKHGDEFKDIAKEIDNIIQDGEVVKRQGRDEAYNIEYNGFKVGINKGFNKQGENKWIVTAFDDNIEKTAKTAPANDSTKGASLPLNSKDIIPQQTPKETQDSTAQTIDNFKKEFNIHDKAFKPTGHVRDNTKTGELEVLDTLNEYRPILNKDTYKKDGYYVISNHHNDLELLDFNGFNLGKVYHKKYDGQHRLFNIQDLELLENVSKDFLLLNGNKTLEQAKKLAQSKTKKGVYIDYFNEIQDPIKSINKATTKDGVEIYTLNTQKFKQKEPLTNLIADSKQLSQKTSQETKEIILNHILENDRLLYLLKQGINTQHLSPFQKEVLESVLDIANNPTKYKAYKLQGLQKQLNNLNESEAYLKTSGNYDKARYAKDREELEREIAALKGESSDIIATESNKENTYILREQTKEILNSLVGKNITNQNDGRIAQISRKNIAKMTSDKAIQKSVDNGFTPQEHFKAVQDIENLYQGAVLKETHKDKKSENPNVFIHRYNADFNGNNALITIKESLDSNSKGNKIYTLELEALELKPSAPEPQGSATMSRNTIRKAIVTPTETPATIIPQTPQEIIKQAKASGKSVAETKELLQKHKDIESKRKETQKLITQEKEAKENLHKEIDIFEKEKQNALEKLESIKTQINELEKKDLSSKQVQKQMDKLQTNLSFFANEIEKTRNLIKQRKDKLATTQEVYIPQNHTFSYDGREFNTREHFSILKQRSLNNQDDDFNGFDTLMREAIENALNIKPIKEFGTNYAEHYHSGETAIQKLISEAQAHKESGAKGEYKGQVAGAFHRKELGDIDLVWGEVTDFEKHKGYRLAHILDKHPEFDVFNIPKVIEQGRIEKTYNGYNIVTDDYIVGLNKGFKDKEGNIINDSNVWVVTSFEPQAKLKKGS